MNTTFVVLLALAGLLFPAGVVLWADGSGRRTGASFALASAAIGMAGFFVCGFGLAFGAAGGRYPALGDLEALNSAWTPLQPWLGPGWLIAGAGGFLLSLGDEGGAYALFLLQAVLLASALSVMAVTLAGRARPMVLALAATLASCLAFPLAAAWTWGAGWLYSLGSLRGLGHGFVDAGGVALVAVIAGAGGLAALLVWPRQQADAAGRATLPTPETAVSPSSGAGALLMVGGLLSLQAGSTMANGLSPALPLANGLTAAAFGCCMAMSYMGFTTGKLDGRMASRGLVAGLIAVSAGAPFIAPPAAALIGSSAGLLTCFAAYLVETLMRRDDPAGAASAFLVPGLWGLLAVGMLADGRTGAGWHGVGPLQYLGAAGQGVTGLMPAAGLAADPEQMTAQLIGAAAVLAWSFLPLWLLLRLAKGSEASPEAAAEPVVDALRDPEAPKDAEAAQEPVAPS